MQANWEYRYVWNLSERYFLLCLKINITSIAATDKPEIPGNKMNRYSTPHTPTSESINSNPLSGDSILNAATKANKKKTIARLGKNICKDALSMLS
jgi:hypothetical protein